jgi:hypothetical protein
MNSLKTWPNFRKVLHYSTNVLDRMPIANDIKKSMIEYSKGIGAGMVLILIKLVELTAILCGSTIAIISVLNVARIVQTHKLISDDPQLLTSQHPYLFYVGATMYMTVIGFVAGHIHEQGQEKRFCWITFVGTFCFAPAITPIATLALFVMAIGYTIHLLSRLRRSR